MPRRSRHFSHVLSVLRRYLALQQQQLAEYLDISPEMVKHIEAGRRELSSAALLRVLPLVRVVPDHPALDATEYNDLPLVEPAPGELEWRLRVCLHKARHLRWKMAPLARRTRFAKRWQLVLPGLLAALPAEADSADDHTHPAARERRWLLARQAEAAADLSADRAAEWHLLRVRAEGLIAEAVALIALLPQVPEWAREQLAELNGAASPGPPAAAP